MLNFIKKLFQFLVPSNTHQAELDHYITAHNPQSVGDVENLTRRYEQRMQQSFFAKNY